MSTITTRHFLQSTGIVLAGLVLAACGKQEPPAASAPAAAPAPAAKVYVVGTDAAYAPFESQNEKGEIVGFDVDIANALCEQIKRKCVFVTNRNMNISLNH